MLLTGIILTKSQNTLEHNIYPLEFFHQTDRLWNNMWQVAPKTSINWMLWYKSVPVKCIYSWLQWHLNPTGHRSVCIAECCQMWLGVCVYFYHDFPWFFTELCPQRMPCMCCLILKQRKVILASTFESFSFILTFRSRTQHIVSQ